MEIGPAASTLGEQVSQQIAGLAAAPRILIDRRRCPQRACNLVQCGCSCVGWLLTTLGPIEQRCLADSCQAPNACRSPQPFRPKLPLGDLHHLIRGGQLTRAALDVGLPHVKRLRQPRRLQCPAQHACRKASEVLQSAVWQRGRLAEGCRVTAAQRARLHVWHLLERVCQSTIRQRGRLAEGCRVTAAQRARLHE